MANTNIISTLATNYANSTISPFAGSLVRDTFNNLDFYVDLSRNGNDAVPQAVIMLSTGMYQQRSTSGGLGGTVRGDELDLPYIFPYRFTMNRRVGTITPENFDYECTDCSNFPANGTIVSGIGRYSINQMLDNYLFEHWHGEPFLPGYGWDDPILKWIDENGVEHTVTNPTYVPQLFPAGGQYPGPDSPWLPWNPKQEFDGWKDVCGWYLPGYTVKNPNFPEDNVTLSVPSIDPISAGACPQWIVADDPRSIRSCEICHHYGFDSIECKTAVGYPGNPPIGVYNDPPGITCYGWDNCGELEGIKDFFMAECRYMRPSRLFYHNGHWWLQGPSGRLWFLGKYWQQATEDSDPRNRRYWIPYVPGMGIPVSLEDCRLQLYEFLPPWERLGLVYPGTVPSQKIKPEFPEDTVGTIESSPRNPFEDLGYQQIEDWINDPTVPPNPLWWRRAEYDDCRSLNPIVKPVYPPSR